ALGARMPGVVAQSPEPDARPFRLRLTLSAQGVARVALTDAEGALRLERELDLPKGGAAAGTPRDRADACAALAETVALIVERYMRHIGYHEPPPPALIEPNAVPPPPPPPAPLGPARRLGVGVAARPPLGASWRFEPELTGAVRFGHLDVAASAGADLPADEAVPKSGGHGSLDLRIFPARLALGWTIPLDARFALVPALGTGVDVVLAETRGIIVTRRSTAVEPVVEAGVRARATLTRLLWLDLHAFGGLDLRPEQFIVFTNPMGTSAPETVFMTPRVYTRIGVDFGVYLGKK
ncbi:MAG TPA: hypothetical protein VMT47_15535, partial [Polyangia bacterium]|nr:hypothetical protein [Polyangia bacterium]